MVDCVKGLREAAYNTFQSDEKNDIAAWAYSFLETDDFYKRARSGEFGANLPIPLPDGGPVIDLGVSSSDADEQSFRTRFKKITKSKFTQAWALNTTQRLVDPVAQMSYRFCIQGTGISHSIDTQAIKNGQIAVTVSARVVDVDDDLPEVIAVECSPFKFQGGVDIFAPGTIIPAAGLTQIYQLPADAMKLKGSILFAFSTTRGSFVEKIESGTKPNPGSRVVDISFEMSPNAHAGIQQTPFRHPGVTIKNGTTWYFGNGAKVNSQPAVNSTERFGDDMMMVAVRVEADGRITLGTASKHTGNTIQWGSSFVDGDEDTSSSWNHLRVKTVD